VCNLLRVKGLVSRVAWRVGQFAAVALLAGCAHERVLASGHFYTLRVVAGDAQTAPAGTLLPQPLTVEVRDAAGMPIRATIVVFRVIAGAGDGAAVLDTLSVTDDAGRAQAELRLGSRAGAVEVRVLPIAAEERAVSVRATATGGPTISGVLPGSVGPGDTLAIAGSALGGAASTVEFGSVRVRAVAGSDGEIRVVVPDCLPPGAIDVRVLSGAAWTATRPVTYAPRRRPISLRLFEAVLIPAGELASCATLASDAGAEYLLIPQLAAQAASPVSTVLRVTVGGATTAALFGGTSPAGLTRDAAWSAQSALDHALREQERRLAPFSRGAEPAPQLMLALTLGSLRTFHVITTLAGDEFTDATGKLRWLGQHLGIYVDTTTASAYTDADLERLGRLFDTDLYGTVVGAFGPESDIDRNGRVLVFLTPRVNALVASSDCGQRGFVTGFFYGRDLLPSMANSNAGEIFYGLVPDAYLRYSCSHAPYDVERLLPGTFVHEMQHMISFFHHVVARGGDAEEHWVNEGLSHIAEELASQVFEARYPWPLRRTTPGQLFPDSAGLFMSQQLMNAYVYLYNSAAHSVTTFQGTGSMEERGAAWLFLRWLGDQKGASIYRKLVQTSLTGVANVEARSGERFATLFGDFTVAIWADSIPGVPRSQVAPRYRFASRNLRQLMARQAFVSLWPDSFPVRPVHVPNAGLAEGSLLPGTMVYLSLGPFAAGQGATVLGMAKSAGGAFSVGEGAQLGILRVR